MILGGIVYDVRDQIVEGLYADEELESVVSFHDATEELWRLALSTRPVIAPDVLLARLKRLHGMAVGPLLGYRERLIQATDKASALQQSKLHRDVPAEEP